MEVGVAISYIGEKYSCYTYLWKDKQFEPKCFRGIAQNFWIIFKWWSMLQLSLGNNTHLVPGKLLTVFYTNQNNSWFLTDRTASRINLGKWLGKLGFVISSYWVLFLINNDCSSITAHSHFNKLLFRKNLPLWLEC